MKKLPLFLSLISLISVENQNYGSVIGNSAAPFINNNLTVLGSVMSAYHSYAQGISGTCSAGCYVAILGGNTEGSLCSLSNSTCSASTSCGSGQSYCDSYCHAASSPCIKTRTLIHDFAGNSLTWKAYCENSCHAMPTTSHTLDSRKHGTLVSLPSQHAAVRTSITRFRALLELGQKQHQTT